MSELKVWRITTGIPLEQKADVVGPNTFVEHESGWLEVVLKREYDALKAGTLKMMEECVQRGALAKQSEIELMKAENARLKEEVKMIEGYTRTTSQLFHQGEVDRLKAELAQAKQYARDWNIEANRVKLLVERYRASLLKVFSCLPEKFNGYQDGGQSIWLTQSDIDHIDEARKALEGEK